MAIGQWFARGKHQDTVVSAASDDATIEDHFEGHDHEGDFVTDNERNDLARGLHQRHIGLIALAGAIVSQRSDKDIPDPNHTS